MTELPAYIGKLKALLAQATPGLWQADPLKGHVVQPFVVALRNHAPELLALVETLARERNDLKTQIELDELGEQAPEGPWCDIDGHVYWLDTNGQADPKLYVYAAFYDGDSTKHGDWVLYMVDHKLGDGYEPMLFRESNEMNKGQWEQKLTELGLKFEHDSEEWEDD